MVSDSRQARSRGIPGEAGPTIRHSEEVDTYNDWSYYIVMKHIAAAKFKEQCLALLDQVDPDGIVITKRGKPVAKLIPFASDSASLIGSLAGKLEIKGGILSTGLGWYAER